MAKKFLTDLDLAKNELRNGRIQNLASAPSSPVAGQIYYDTTLHQFGVYNDNTTSWDYMGTGSVTGPSSSVDGEIALFNSTTGKLIKRATTSGLLKAASGVIAAAVSGTDYAPATSGTSALKGNGSGGFSNATLNDVGAPTTSYSMNSQKLTSVADPTSAQDAATKNYVDLAVQGINWKASVRVATTTAGTLASSYANGSTLDGVTLATGDRILIKNQPTATENGIYLVASAGAPTRAIDADTGTELQGAAVFVREGTVNADSAWVNAADGSITLGSTNLTFVQFSQSGGMQSGTTTTAGIVRLATTAEAQQRSLSTVAVTPASLSDTPRKFTATIGDGTSTSIAVAHNLGNFDVIAQIRDASNNTVVECDIVMTSATIATFNFASAPASSAYKVTIIG